MDWLGRPPPGQPRSRKIVSRMSASNLPTWLALASPVLFLALWLLIGRVLSVIGGWRELALSYAGTAPPEGRSFSFRSATLGLVNYNRCLRFVAAPTGLFIAAQFPFSYAHQPLFIPWEDVSASSHRGWIFGYVDLRFSKQPRVQVRLLRGFAEKLAATEGRLPLPDPASS